MAEFDPSAWQGKQRLALLIGIDDYRGEDLNPLKGCVNDIQSLAALLHEKFDFAVACLYDQQATRQAILSAMQNLLDVAGDGAQVVFGWSGHGSRLTLADGSFHETLVPCDSRRIGWSGNRDITDRELYGWVCRITDKKDLGLTLIIDGCRAGGAIRDLQPRPRGATAETTSVKMAAEKSAFLPVTFDRTQVCQSGWLPVSQRYTLLAACLSEEYCREVEDPRTLQKRGLFSYHLQNALAAQREPLTWRDLFEKFSAAVTLHNSTQHPQLEGRIDRLVFEQQEFRPNFYLPVVECRGENVVLGGGAIHGVCRFSIWSILPAGSRDAAGEGELGQVQIQNVGATRSEGTLMGEPPSGAIAAGQRAFEIGRPIDRSFHLLLAPSARADSEMLTLIYKVPFLTLEEGIDGESAAAILHRIPARAFCPDGGPLPQLPRLDRECWALLDPGGAQLAPPFPFDVKGHRAAVVAKIGVLARHRFLSALEHPDPEISVAGKIELEAFRLHENAHYDVTRIEPLGKHPPTLKPGTRIAFQITNRHSAPILVTLIGTGLTGGIDVLYPPPGRNERIAPQGRLQIGFHAADALELGLPEDFPFPGEPPFKRADDALLFLFTAAETRNLELMARRGPRPGRRSSLADLALLMSTGNIVRSDATPDALEKQEAWGLIRWRYSLKP